MSVFIEHTNLLKIHFMLFVVRLTSEKQELKTENLFHSLTKETVLFFMTAVHSLCGWGAFHASDFSVELYIYWLIQASLPAARHSSEQRCISYAQLGIRTVEGTRMLPSTTTVLSLIWAGLALSFARPCESTECSPSPSSLAVWQALWRHTSGSTGGQVNHAGPVLIWPGWS